MVIAERLIETAAHTLASMQRIYLVAKGEQDGRRGHTSDDVFVHAPSGLADHAVRQRALRLAEARLAVSKELAAILDAPVVARVRYETDEGEIGTLLVAPGGLRVPQEDVDAVVASPRSPMGRIAELPVGDERLVRLQDRELYVTVLERLRLVPLRVHLEWDGIRCWFESDDERLTLRSLRELLTAAGASPAGREDDPLALLWSEEDEKAIVARGFQRSVLDHMSLRAQPILDEFQGEVFRMPIDRQLVLLGPAGTGKTTTLIRRIAQKLNEQHLYPEELGALDVGRTGQRLATSNWAMFTPTELLQHYLKEAFAREGVPAPDQRVQTWAVKRRRLAREVLGILPTEGRSRFILDQRQAILTATDGSALVETYSCFEQWCLADTRTRLLAAAEEAVAASEGFLKTLAETWTAASEEERATDRFEVEGVQRGLIDAFQTEVRRAASSLQQTVGLAGLVQACSSFDVPTQLLTASRELLRTRTNDSLNRVLRREGLDFLDRMASFLEDVEGERHGPGASVEIDEDDDDDDESGAEGASLTPTQRRKLAADAYRRAVTSLARARHARRKLGRNGLVGRLVDWLGAERLPSASVIEELGEATAIIRAVGRLRNAPRDLVSRCPSQYRRFRRAQLKQGRLVREDAEQAVQRNRIEPAEVDIVMLFMLRTAVETFRRRREWLVDDGVDHGAPAVLVSIRENLLTQVYVDEVTDFSPVQIACMYALAHPQLRSFFACGDLRQRLTLHGIVDVSALRWAVPSIEERSISKGYRQSRRLAELAAAVATLDPALPITTGDEREFDHEGKAPVLIEGCSGEERAFWLTQRVREISRDIGRMPTIAVFVDGDARIQPLRAALEPMLADHNIDVVACHGGQALGDDGSVRIFDVAHIKGLEFEAVFFLDLDKYAETQSALLDKYLYVGVTRAATYLGISCEGALPQMLEPLRGYFATTDWS